VTATQVDRVADVIQRVHLEQYRDNIDGALRLLREAYAAHPDPQYLALERRITAGVKHLDTRETYAEACEQYYWGKKGRPSLRHLERDLRILLGWKTKKLVRHVATTPEFQLLDREVVAATPARVLDAGCGEGRVALTLAARYPAVRVDGIDVSPTNIRLAQRMNRFANVAFHVGFLEDAPARFERCAFDLAYADSVLEHVVDVDVAVTAVMEILRPGGRFCFVVPMNEFRRTGPLPERIHEAGGHVRVFTEAGLRAQFERYDNFVLRKLPGELPRKYPETLVPLEFGAFFVAVSKPH